MTKNTATKPAAATPAAKPLPSNCRCGCNQPTVTEKALFVSGHDARLAGALGRAKAAGPLTKPQQAQYDSLSDALRKKADGVEQTARRKAAEKAARVEAARIAKAAYDKALADALK